MELDICYKRQMDRNYMVIQGEDGIFQLNYEMRMLAENKIQGFLPLTVRQVDCHLEYHYDISSMQPLSRMFQIRKMELKDVQMIFCSLKQQMVHMAPYLLEGEHIMLVPELIYIHPQSFQVYVCYHTKWNQEFQTTLKELLQFILEKFNHEDQNGVVAIYQLYQRSLEEVITIEEILEILFTCYEKEEEKKEETEQICESEVVEIVPKNSNTEKKIGQVVVFGGIIIVELFCLIGFELWKEKEVFFVFLGIIASILLFVIRNVQQEKRKKNMQEENETVFYEKIEEEVVLPGNTGELKNEINHALISENPIHAQHIQIHTYPFIIGRIPDECHVALEIQEISRLHVEIQKKDEDIFVMDLNSSNGTYINGIRLEANTPIKIKKGDKISLAQISYTFY